MKAGDLPHTHFSNLANDFKAEVTAAEMVDLGLSPEDIVILMLGAMKRSMRKDVQSIEEESSVYNHNEYVVIKTPREGFYDMLPEGLFHHPSAHKTAATAKEIAKAIKRRKEEEQQARRFFIPFEAAINHFRIELAYYENRLDKRTKYDDLVSLFSTQWSIFQLLDARQANLFLHLIPILHDIRDDHQAVETVLEMMLQLPVKVQLRNQASFCSAEPVLSIMGESALGVDLTTGNELYDEGVDEILVKIGPLTSEVYQLFQPGGTRHKLLELLIDHLLPVHLDIVTKFDLYDNDRVTKFATNDSYTNSVLGADTFL